MHNLEEQFALLVAGMELPKKQMPDLTWAPRQTFAARSKTVYSVGEAISERGLERDAKLGAGAKRDSGARR